MADVFHKIDLKGAPEPNPLVALATQCWPLFQSLFEAFKVRASFSSVG